MAADAISCAAAISAYAAGAQWQLLSAVTPKLYVASPFRADESLDEVNRNVSTLDVTASTQAAGLNSSGMLQ